MSKRKRKEIGLQNRLEIVIQSLLDFDEEGGDVSFDIENNQLTIIVDGVAERDGQLWLTAADEATEDPEAEATAASTAVEAVAEVSKEAAS
ncbi:MAG TPA: hypothetical protein VLL52_05950 [Anaerolineae bacterium]|nr:hypothetical protein [Anaerolineae bacterium]